MFNNSRLIFLCIIITYQRQQWLSQMYCWHARLLLVSVNCIVLYCSVMYCKIFHSFLVTRPLLQTILQQIMATRGSFWYIKNILYTLLQRFILLFIVKCLYNVFKWSVTLMRALMIIILTILPVNWYTFKKQQQELRPSPWKSTSC